MTLVDEIDKLFETKYEDICDEISELTRLLHKLIDELKGNEKEEIIDLVTDLEVAEQAIQEINKKAIPLDEDKKELTKWNQSARGLINKFMHGPVLTTYRKQPSTKEFSSRSPIDKSLQGFEGDIPAEIDRDDQVAKGAIDEQTKKDIQDLAEMMPDRPIIVTQDERGKATIRLDPAESRSDNTPTPASKYKVIKGGR